MINSFQTEEISKLLNEPVKKIYNTTHRIRDKIKSCLKIIEINTFCVLYYVCTRKCFFYTIKIEVWLWQRKTYLKLI